MSDKLIVCSVVAATSTFPAYVTVRSWGLASLEDNLRRMRRDFYPVEFLPFAAFSLRPDEVDALRRRLATPHLPVSLWLQDAVQHFADAVIERPAQGPIFRHYRRLALGGAPLFNEWVTATKLVSV